ncbi:hypothetical protein OC846_003380 [Tilletia horrida]|uniref:CST complex subunit Stn1 N-terminal domain-containing protein n=1 Tax=Tilletia horrida TaxID=155126 RepID=A0AAN6JU03_9BASI|nr:hypothetical protein OC845_005750 [Tilletia horrida]KAK0551241.1 hypothetical protein OC846_003380 [Tilletia horrida]KAK0561618.1 hypothetical protein OC861_005732 [Tilletia horrida]
MSRTRSVASTAPPREFRINLNSQEAKACATHSTSKVDKGKARAIDPPLNAYDLKNPSVAGKIYAWAAHPINAALCFGIDIVNAQSLRADGFPGSVYLYHQRPLVLAEIVGMIVGSTEKEHRIIYLVDDGTTILQVIHNVQEDSRRVVHPSGTVIRVIGKIRMEWEERVLQVESLSVLTDLDDEARHIFAVIEAQKTAYSKTFELTEPPPAQLPAIPTAPEPPRPTTIPAAYLPPVYTNATYYSRREIGSSSYGRTLPSPGATPTQARYEPRARSGPTLPSPGSTPPQSRPRFVRTGPTLPSPSPSPSPERTPPPISRCGAARLRSASASASSVARSSPSVVYQGHSVPDASAPATQQQRRLRAWHKLTGSELSPSRFRPYVAQHIHMHCSSPDRTTSGPRSVPSFTVRYLRRQEDLRKHAEKVVLRALKKRHRLAAAQEESGSASARTDKVKRKPSSSSSSVLSDPDHGEKSEIAKLSSEALGAKVKRLFESVIRQLVEDGVIEIAPERDKPVWPFNGRKYRIRTTVARRKQALPSESGRGQNAGRKWGGNAAEMFHPFLGDSDSEDDLFSPAPLQLRKTPTPATARSKPSREKLPSSSGSYAMVDESGRTILSGSTRANGSTKQFSRSNQKKGASAANAIVLSSSPPQAARDIITISSDEDGSGKSSGDITSDTEESSTSSSSSSGEEEGEQLGRGSPTPKAKRIKTMSATQRAEAVWKSGGMSNAAVERRRPRQEAYRLVLTVVTKG